MVSNISNCTKHSKLKSVIFNWILEISGKQTQRQLNGVSIEQRHSLLRTLFCNFEWVLNNEDTLEDMCVQTSYDKGPHPLMWACSWAARGKITISGVPNCLKYCVIFVIYTQFTNTIAGCIIKPGGPRVGNPCFRKLWIIWSWGRRWNIAIIINVVRI
jgi:hypothetical protein